MPGSVWSDACSLRLCQEEPVIEAGNEFWVECRVSKDGWKIQDDRAHSIAYLVAIDVGAMHSRNLRPDLGVQSKGVADRFLCSQPVRLENHSRWQTVCTSVSPLAYATGQGRIFLQLVIENTQIGRDRWTYLPGTGLPLTALEPRPPADLDVSPPSLEPSQLQAWVEPGRQSPASPDKRKKRDPRLSSKFLQKLSSAGSAIRVGTRFAGRSSKPASPSGARSPAKAAIRSPTSPASPKSPGSPWSRRKGKGHAGTTSSISGSQSLPGQVDECAENSPQLALQALLDHLGDAKNSGLASHALASHAAGDHVPDAEAFAEHTDGCQDTELSSEATNLPGQVEEPVIALALQALEQHTNDCHNAVLTSETLADHVQGSHNTALASEALANHVEDSRLTGLAAEVLADHVEDSHNIGLASESLAEHVEDSHNTGLTSEALADHVEDSHNTGLATEALADHVEDGHNTGVASEALADHAEGSHNSGLASAVLADHVEDSYNASTAAESLAGHMEGRLKDGPSLEPLAEDAEHREFRHDVGLPLQALSNKLDASHDSGLPVEPGLVSPASSSRTTSTRTSQMTKSSGRSLFRMMAGRVSTMLGFKRRASDEQ